MKNTQLFETRAKLIQMRNMLNISQVEMAKRLGQSQPAVCRFENGCNIGWQALLNYAHAIGVELKITIV